MLASDSNVTSLETAASARRTSSPVKAESCFCGTDRCVPLAMSPINLLENGVISLESVGLKVHQIMLLWLLLLRLLRLSRPFLASAPSSLGSTVAPGTLNDSPVQVSLTLARLKTSSTSTFRIGFWSNKLICVWRQVFYRYGFVGNFCWNRRKDHGRFKTPWPHLRVIKFQESWRTFMLMS